MSDCEGLSADELLGRLMDERSRADALRDENGRLRDELDDICETMLALVWLILKRLPLLTSSYSGMCDPVFDRIAEIVREEQG